MRAAVFHEHGDSSVLQIAELDPPTLAPGHAIVKVAACGLNRLDLAVRLGWKGLNLELPHVGGTDFMGTIHEIDGEGFAVGDRVMVNPGLNFESDEFGNNIVPPEPQILGETQGGGLAEFVSVPVTHLHPVPADMSDAEAACLPLTIQTATQMLRLGGALRANADSYEVTGAGKRILVIGGGGGVSVVAIQLAKATGAHVTVVAGGPEKCEFAKEIGADEAIDYKQFPDWTKLAYFASGKNGYEIVLDNVGQATWAQSLRCLRQGGKLVTCGATTGPIGETNIALVFWKQLQIIGSTMGTTRDLEWGLSQVQVGTLRPMVDRVFEMEEIQAAHDYLASGQVRGKVIVRVS